VLHTSSAPASLATSTDSLLSGKESFDEKSRLDPVCDPGRGHGRSWRAGYLDAPREVNVLLSDRTMQTWDAMFLDNLARDGILLYARGSLPALLAARQSLQERLEDKGVIL
jgi:hypothetical protein